MLGSRAGEVSGGQQVPKVTVDRQQVTCQSCFPVPDSLEGWAVLQQEGANVHVALLSSLGREAKLKFDHQGPPSVPLLAISAP